jgi:hypothetical protein
MYGHTLGVSQNLSGSEIVVLTNMASVRHVHNQRTVRRAMRRRTEDVDYWRKRSGWFDDDKAMKEYNDGVYDTYYQLDDDRTHRSSSFRGGANSDLVKNSIKVLAVVVALALCFLMFRILNRRFGESSEKKDGKKKRSSSTGRSERSSSRTRSRSRSRRGDYDLMSEDNEKPHSRSRSKSGRSRSRTRARSRSASRRTESDQTPPAAQAEAVLV